MMYYENESGDIEGVKGSGGAPCVSGASEMGVPIEPDGYAIQRTVTDISTRTRITLPKGINRFTVLPLVHDGSAPADDEVLFVVVNATSTTAADGILNGGVLPDSPDDDRSDLQIFELGKWSREFVSSDFELATLDLLPGRAGSASSHNLTIVVEARP